MKDSRLIKGTKVFALSAELGEWKLGTICSDYVADSKKIDVDFGTHIEIVDTPCISRYDSEYPNRLKARMLSDYCHNMELPLGVLDRRLKMVEEIEEAQAESPEMAIWVCEQIERELLS